MYIPRKFEFKAKQLAQEYPILTILGPRQSGKTTFVKKMFAQHKYINMERYDNRDFADNDPAALLQQYKNEHGIIFDEVQHTPKLLSYLQDYVDQEYTQGYFILSGSQNLLLNAKITQTLAGRTAILKLLPLSLAELLACDKLPNSVEELIFQGSYPKIYAEQVNIADLYDNYITTYLERDVRQLKNINDLNLFQTFLKLCAGRTGQILNLTELGKDCGIDSKTVRSWISVLEASYVVFLLQPYYNNFNKRIIKAPKLYFYDTGIACSLLGIEDSKSLASHYLRGGLFENLIIIDLLKQRLNVGSKNNCYYWRDQAGNEIDCILEKDSILYPIEIKAGTTIYSKQFKNILAWENIAKSSYAKAQLIYAGAEDQNRSQIDIYSWKNISDLQGKLSK